MSSKPIHVPDDFKGTKIRVNAFPIQIKTFSNMGAAPTPMALGDVYTGLQQGTIDGLETVSYTHLADPLLPVPQGLLHIFLRPIVKQAAGVDRQLIPVSPQVLVKRKSRCV